MPLWHFLWRWLLTPTYIFYFIGDGAEMFGGFKENTNNAISMAKLVDPEAEFPRKPYKKAILQY